MATYRAGLEQDPENEEMKEGIQKCIEQINKAGRGQLSDEELKERQQKAMADPEIQMILQDPIMRQAPPFSPPPPRLPRPFAAARRAAR